MAVRKASQVQAERVPDSLRAFRQVLIGPEEGPHFALRRFTIEAGGRIPRHTNAVEHEQYILQGRATISIGDQTYSVQADDVVFIPARVPHGYQVEGDEPFVFLCAIPNGPDEIEIVE